MITSKIKRFFYSIILSLFLLAGLYINYELDKDFLSQFGFEGFFVVVSILFFIGLKVISELLFFRLKGGAKWLVGSFAFFVIIGSILSIFFVRIYKSESIYQAKTNENTAIDKKKQEVNENRTLLLNQIKSLDSQIQTKLTMIQTLHPEESKWLRHRYNKEINDLNSQKLTLLKEIQTINLVKPIERRQTTLHDALNHAFGVESQLLTLAVNLIFTIFVDSALLLLCFGLTFVLNISDETKLVNSNLTINLPIENEVYLQKKKGDSNSILEKLERAMKNAEINQDRFAQERLGISKVALWKIRTGKTKNISQEIRQRIEALS